MSEIITLSPNPQGFGYVVGRIVRRSGGNGSVPEVSGAVGTVKFTPVRGAFRVGDGVSQNSVMSFPLDSEGNIFESREEDNALPVTGAWLGVGKYKVEFNLRGGHIKSFTIVVEESHTVDAPLDIFAEEYPRPTGNIDGVSTSGSIRYIDNLDGTLTLLGVTENSDGTITL